MSEQLYTILKNFKFQIIHDLIKDRDNIKISINDKIN